MDGLVVFCDEVQQCILDTWGVSLGKNRIAKCLGRAGEFTRISIVHTLRGCQRHLHIESLLTHKYFQKMQELQHQETGGTSRDDMCVNVGWLHVQKGLECEHSQVVRVPTIRRYVESIPVQRVYQHSILVNLCKTKVIVPASFEEICCKLCISSLCGLALPPLHLSTFLDFIKWIIMWLLILLSLHFGNTDTWQTLYVIG